MYCIFMLFILASELVRSILLINKELMVAGKMPLRCWRCLWLLFHLQSPMLIVWLILYVLFCLCITLCRSRKIPKGDISIFRVRSYSIEKGYDDDGLMWANMSLGATVSMDAPHVASVPGGPLRVPHGAGLWSLTKWISEFPQMFMMS
jgi:hypothetical protein